VTKGALILRVTLHAPLYHGQPEWPPSPARLFQALVAGASRRLDEPAVAAALRWLEVQPPPVIGVPSDTQGQVVTGFVPNNDLDAKGGDPAQIGSIRVAKSFQARHLDHPELLFIWDAVESAHAATIVDIAKGLYQFGRGVDMAFAQGEVVDEETRAAIVAGWKGPVHFPSPGAPGTGLACPRLGSLTSVHARFADSLNRFQTEGKGKKATEVFAQPRKALWQQVPYDAAARRAVYELHRVGEPGRFAPQSAAEAPRLVTQWRDAALARLVSAGLEAEMLEGVLVGRRPGAAMTVPSHLRARFVPLPSIGHEHVDGQIRRLYVDLPVGGPLIFDDLRWALSGLVANDVMLVESFDLDMVGHYSKPSRIWVTVTPMALAAARRRIDPARQKAEAKGAPERNDEEVAAIHAVRDALRHAGIREVVRSIDVQREPFGAHGLRAEAFDAPPRFPKDKLWNVRIVFARELSGLQVLGDGRFLGLGLLRPDLGLDGPVTAFAIAAGLEGQIQPHELARHLRRAVMARAQAIWGKRAKLPPAISAHGEDDGPAAGHEHLYYLVDPQRRRLLVWHPSQAADGLMGHPQDLVLEAPPVKSKEGKDKPDIRTHKERPDEETKRMAKEVSKKKAERQKLARALDGLTELRAGAMGVLALETVPLDEGDPLVATSAMWRSVTPYRVQRHAKVGSAAEAVRLDVEAACAGYPPVAVTVFGARAVDGALEAERVELRFSRPVAGPLALGKTAHLGGGLFEAFE